MEAKKITDKENVNQNPSNDDEEVLKNNKDNEHIKPDANQDDTNKPNDNNEKHKVETRKTS